MKKILTFITLSLVLFLTGCHVEDQNGEDNYELATYTLEDVKNNKVKKNTNIGSVSMGTLDHGFLKVKKFSGKRELVIRSVIPGDQVKIISSVEKGNLGIFIKCLDEVYQIPINTEYTFTFESFKGISTIIIIGESAKFRVDYDFID